MAPVDAGDFDVVCESDWRFIPSKALASSDGRTVLRKSVGAGDSVAAVPIAGASPVVTGVCEFTAVSKGVETTDPGVEVDGSWTASMLSKTLVVASADAEGLDIGIASEESTGAAVGSDDCGVEVGLSLDGGVETWAGAVIGASLDAVFGASVVTMVAVGA